MIDETRQIQSAEHARGKREDGRLIVHLLLGVAPVSLLFRKNHHARACRDGRINQRIALVGSGLQIQAGQLRVIGAHGAGTAVFNHHIRMTATQIVKPIQIRTAMPKQAVANGFGIQISADAGSGVVVELEEHRAEIVD